jgi:16S rRNA (adenine1518-N6/adenine1519-N6)-dimethyltransferase
MCPRRLGQHFLHDAAWRARILRELQPRSDQSWLEVGAGGGEMTRELAPHVRRVVAVEIDPPLVEKLMQLASTTPGVEVSAGDILRLDLQQFMGREKFYVYGSLPYYITSPILRKLFSLTEAIERISVIVQYEVAARLGAQPGGREYGFLSVLAQFYTQPMIAFRIPPGAFRPPPKVASALVHLPLRKDRTALEVTDETAFLKFVGRCFEQKRKTLVNNLKPDYGAKVVAAALRERRLRADARAEQLSLQEFVELYNSLDTTTGGKLSSR